MNKRKKKYLRYGMQLKAGKTNLETLWRHASHYQQKLES